MRIFATSCLALFSLLALPGKAAEPPTEIRSSYGVYRNGLRVGTVQESFVRNGDRYRILSETVAAGAIAWLVRDKLTITSEGLITPSGLQPLNYVFQREKDPRKTVRANFDWQALVMQSAHDGRQETVPLKPGTQDRLSIMYQFMFASTRAPQVGAWMTNGKQVEQYVYVKQGDPQIKTEAGEFDATHYKRRISADEDQAEIWLARDSLLPLRVLFTRTSGARDEQTLLTYSVR